MNTIKKLAASMAMAAMVLGLGVVNAADITGEDVTSSDQTLSTATDLTISFVTTTDLVNGGQIDLQIPGAFTGFGTLLPADVSVASDGTATFDATESFDTATQTISIAITGNGGASETITISFANTKLTNPGTAGLYGAVIKTYSDAGTTQVDTGLALIPVDAGTTNDVTITANVLEALTLTIDNTSIGLTVDPSANNGEDFSQKNVLNVKTNATSGYSIKASLDDGAGNAQLVDGANTIIAGDATATENRFGILGFNGDGTAYAPALDVSGQQNATATITATDLKLLNFQTLTTSEADVEAGETATNTDTGTVSWTGAANNYAHTVYYGLNVDYLTPAGTYTGTITYTAVPTF